MVRYIDADKLIAYLTNGLIEFYNCDGYRMIPEEVKEIMERALEHMEIVDVREVVHGEWDMSDRPHVRIYCCADCIHYSMKKHKCILGAKEEGPATATFYVDCPKGVHHDSGMTQSEKIEALKTYCLRHGCMECILNSPIVLDEHDGDCIVSCWEDGLLLDMADEQLVDYLYTRMVSET